MERNGVVGGAGEEKEKEKERERERERGREKSVKEITNYYIGGGSLRKIGLYWELRKGDPYLGGSLEAAHSGPSLRAHRGLRTLDALWFQTRELCSSRAPLCWCIDDTPAHTHTHTTVSVLPLLSVISIQSDSYGSIAINVLFLVSRQRLEGE